jgi:Uma2 family endonuclease
MTVSTIKMTARQFLQLGEDPPGVRLVLVNGEIAVSPSPTPKHSFVVLELARLLGNYIEDNDLGRLLADVDTIFGEHDVRRPDLLFFKKAREHLIGEEAIEGAPDLCVEVLSPSSIRADRREKFALYASEKVKHYWIVDPKLKTIEAYALKSGKYSGGVRGSNSDTVSLAPFPKLKIPLARLWLLKRR